MREIKQQPKPAIDDLFAGSPGEPAGSEPLGPGATVLRGFAAAEAPALMQALAPVLAAAPFRHMVTPGGYRMSVAMTNCGQFGWVTDRRGYRYQPLDPESGRAWPPMPSALHDLAVRAAEAAGFPGFEPDSCLINRYDPDARLSLHQDRNERDYAAPIVSVSLGLAATFLFGGMSRSDRPRRIPLQSGDVVVWGGPARLVFHGVEAIAQGEHPLTGCCRINLAFRRYAD